MNLTKTSNTWPQHINLTRGFNRKINTKENKIQEVNLFAEKYAAMFFATIIRDIYWRALLTLCVFATLVTS